SHSRAHPRARTSFPTRRSSDLISARERTWCPPLDTGAGGQVRLFWRPRNWSSEREPVLRAGGLPLAESPTTRDDTGAIFLKALRSEEHTSELQSRENLVCRLLL